MPQFRKKPVVIEAWPNWTGDPEIDGAHGRMVRAPAWLNDAIRDKLVVHGPKGVLLVTTLEGTMRADVGDWIIQGVNGEVYPCKPDIFAKTYEPVEDEAHVASRS